MKQIKFSKIKEGMKVILVNKKINEILIIKINSVDKPDIVFALLENLTRTNNYKEKNKLMNVEGDKFYPYTKENRLEILAELL